MLVDEMPRSFSKKNNSYSHCPLKKRPVNVVEDKTEIKEEIIDVVDITPEPENLSTKPEDLSRASLKRARSPSPAHCPPESRSPTIYSAATRSPSPPAFRPAAHVPYYPPKIVTPPSAAIAPVHPVAKKARVEVIQHNPSAFVSSAQRKVLVPVESLGYYPSGDWERARAAPLYSPQYLPYPAYRYPTGEIYPSYPVAAYPHSSPEHHSVSPSPPHSSFGCQSIPRPVPISSYNGQWLSPLEPSVYSPTNSVGSASLRSTPPVSPEDLSSSSPGSESGRSSVGSIPPSSSSVKLEKSPASSSSTTSGTTPPRYKCGHCSKSYTTYSGMSKHEQFHCAAAEGQQKKTFTCKYCPKIYMTLGALKMHIRTHTLPCKCTLCGKAFSRPWLLQGHIRTHTGEKPFSCQHCNRAFADRSNLRAHLQTHSDVKKYSCNSCSKTFSRMSLLTKHQEGGCPSVGVPIGYAC